MKSSVRIGIDGNEANVESRVGSNIYSHELLRHIEILDKENEYIIYLSEKGKQDLPKSRKKFSYRVIPPSVFWTQWRLPLDLFLHNPQPQVFFTPGHYAPRFSPIPSVISILDLSFIKFPEAFKPRVLKQLTNWTLYSARNATHIFTISQSSKKDIINSYGIAENKITVTYPGLRDEFKQKISQSDIEKVKVKHGLTDKYLLFLGTWQLKKNAHRLLNSFQAVRSTQKQPVTLVLSGKTWGQFADFDIDRSLLDEVKMTGFVSDSDLPALMKGAQAFVLPSLYEGFGIPVVEAMAAGTPVVVSNVSSLPEVVEDAGILINPKSTESIMRGLKLVLSLPKAKRVQLIGKGKKQAKKFTWESCAKKTINKLYEIAIQGSHGA